MFKRLTGVVVGLAVSVMSVGEVKAETYVDSNEISDWARPYVEQLSNIGCYVGYPDGTLKPTNEITRQELAVVLTKCLEAVQADSNLTQVQINNLSLQIQELQARLEKQEKVLSQQAAALVLVQQEQNRKRDNHVGVGFAYGFNGPGAVALEGKFRIINFNDTLGVSLRPGVNTTKEVYMSATLDADVSDDLTIYGGAGAALSFNSDFTGLLTSGRDGDVTPYAQAGAELDLSRTVGIFADVKVPLENDTFSDVVGTVGIFTKF